jgi:hypothetical protein
MTISRLQSIGVAFAGAAVAGAAFTGIGADHSGSVNNTHSAASSHTVQADFKLASKELPTWVQLDHFKKRECQVNIGRAPDCWSKDYPYSMFSGGNDVAAQYPHLAPYKCDPAQGNRSAVCGLDEPGVRYDP